jgi:hypothetical protein
MEPQTAFDTIEQSSSCSDLLESCDVIKVLYS